LRTNTRELRLKDKYIKEKQRLVTEVLIMDPKYKPPPDYKPPKKYMKVFIPDSSKEDAFTNYIG